MDYASAALYLKNIYGRLNQAFWNGELSDITLTIQQKQMTYGHVTLSEVWVIENNGQHELNVAAGGLMRPIKNIVATIMHECVHIYCMQNSIKDTSNNHVYHNKNFKDIAEQHGLLIERHEKYGYTLTTPSQKLIDYCKEQGFKDLHIYRREEGQPIGKGMGDLAGGDSGSGTIAPRRTSSTRKYICDCGISVRATKEVYIICGRCMAVMKEVM
jgi:hypothetical protein